MTQNETISFLDIKVNVFMQSCLAQGRCWLVTSHELGIFLRRHSHWLVSLTPSPHCQDLVNKRMENMGNNRSLIEEDNDGAVTWQIGFITQQSPRVMQTSQSHVCVTLAVTGRLVALQADNKCVSSHYRAGNPANSPRGWVTSGLVSTRSHKPDPPTLAFPNLSLPMADVDTDLKDYRLCISIVDSGRQVPHPCILISACWVKWRVPLR